MQLHGAGVVLVVGEVVVLVGGVYGAPREQAGVVLVVVLVG